MPVDSLCSVCGDNIGTTCVFIYPTVSKYDMHSLEHSTINDQKETVMFPLCHL